MLGNFSVSVSMQKKKWLQVFGGKEKMVWGNSIDDFAKENKATPSSRGLSWLELDVDMYSRMMSYQVLRKAFPGSASVKRGTFGSLRWAYFLW